jgi:hypothetical protein
MDRPGLYRIVGLTSILKLYFLAGLTLYVGMALRLPVVRATGGVKLTLLFASLAEVAVLNKV